MESFLKRTWAEIHLDRLEDNLSNVRRLIQEDKTDIVCVVKANAYGHDDKNVSRFLEECGVKFFAVSNIHEAVRLRQNGIKGDILILGHTPCECAGELSRYDIIQAVVTEEYAVKLAEYARKFDTEIRIHVAIDTGMGRIGLIAGDENECAAAAESVLRISKLEGVNLEGLFTHFSVADSRSESNIAYTDMQNDSFFGVCDIIRQLGINIRHKHCLNSAGGLFHYNPRNTLMRLGIVLYGLMPDRELQMPFTLNPVMELKSAVACVRTLDKGSYVSYGRTFCSDKKIRVATVPIGYADGYPRALSGKAKVLINGKEASVIGRVCMDQIMVDISDIPNVDEGTTVTLIGSDNGRTITADDIAGMCGTIGYEIVCGISKRVPRVIYRNNKAVDVVMYD